ncbi:MAG: hypothetical protein K2M07_05860 [Muribaculaceae bacterium]|nr:hypothetical protein [Muribaculaceae bacterium]
MIKKYLQPSLETGPLQWSEYTDGDTVVSRFKQTEWNKIFSEYSTEGEFRQFVSDCPDTVAVRILRNIPSGKTYGFLTMMLIDARRGVIGLHGGAWARSPGDCMHIYRGLILLITRLLDRGAHVVSSSANNRAAIRFMSGLGFRVYSYRYGMTHYHVTRRQLQKSPLFKRLGGHHPVS